VLIGLALSAVTTGYRHYTDQHRIVITPVHVAQVANDYALQFGSLPDARTLDVLVAEDTREEVLYREGLALGLDKDDLIVRRRVVQKMRFLTEGLNPPAEPSRAQLEAYFKAHAANYAEPARVTFSHIFFSADRGGAGAAKARALQVLRDLGKDVARAPERGDSFPDAYDYTSQDADQLKRLFGATPISTALLEQAPGAWFGPVQSAYGWHLVRIAARTETQPATLDQVADRVRTDYLLEAQQRSNKEAFDRLARQYTVVHAEAAK
jgi:hypothetical protein